MNVSSMWKEQILASKFPFLPNREEDAVAILFNDSPVRLVLLKWIFHLMHGLTEDISVNGLVEYFISVGIVEGDPLKFVQGTSPKILQEKVWKNLFKLASMMKWTPEICKSFTDKYQNEMPESYPVIKESRLDDKHLKELSLTVGDTLDLDQILADLREDISKPKEISIAEENKNVLGKLEGFTDQFRPRLQLKTLDPEKVKHQELFGKIIADLYTSLKSTETVLKSCDTLFTSAKYLESRLDEHKSNSEALIGLVGQLEGQMKMSAPGQQ